ncbi:MAG: acid phosphatase [Methylocystaceae bacterium]|nr:acid phosphatase [Methylocystaceae bacterium]
MKRLIGLFGFFFLFAERPVLAQPPESLHKIEHILIIFEENRSFDNLFGFFPGADGIPSDDKLFPQSDRDGKIYATLPQPIDGKLKPPGPDSRFPADLPNKPFLMNGYVKPAEKTGDLVHEFYREQLQINGGRMDKFVAYTNAAGLTMGYYDYKNSHLWKLAETYALGDRMFHSAFGGSYLNHTYLVCGCAFRWPDAPPAIVAQIDEKGRVIKDGQVTPDGYSVNTSRSVYLHAPGDTDVTRLVPPQTMPHIGNRLDEKNISWAWYSGGYDDAMAGKPDPLFQFHHQPLAYFRDLAPGSERQKKHLKDAKDLMQAIDANNLPQVAFYKPIGALNQHPGYANVTDADEHIHEIIEKLKKSPLWSSTLVIITYDENGGSWDHVAPPIRDKWGPGTRVPLIAIGDMVKQNYVDHTAYDFGSILRLISLRFGTEPVNQTDGAATPMTGFLK